MLHITYYDKGEESSGIPRVYESIDGIDDVPMLDHDQIAIIYADGPELRRIVDKITNLCYNHSGTIWRGDMAVFIYENIMR